MFRPVQILWFKRDLRLADHAPLAEAAARGPVLPLVMIEPEYWRLPDTSYRQYQFWSGCIADLQQRIAAAGGALQIRTGRAVEILDDLVSRHPGATIWSHEETGNGWTYGRDRAVRRLARARCIRWIELPNFGVIRGPSLNRDKWAAHWDRQMTRPVIPTPHMNWHPGDICQIPSPEALGLPPDGLVHPQPPGRAAGLGLLKSFLNQRGQTYTRAMSSPVTAEAACSRLSPYLTYGSLSVRETYQAARSRAAELALLPQAGRATWPNALRSFIARLHWHCHFIQKLETEPAAEILPFTRACTGLRPNPGNPDDLAAWHAGRTGYPFLDAAMRYLTHHGWINFRMRALLMSFAAYDLFLPWQQAGAVLARLFTDYEPGIHWPQCQMQSGETGINTIRVYSPVKQGFDQDPNGDFIRAWVPELRHIKGALVHEPWRLDPPPAGYPARIVIHETAAKAAKDALFARRQQPAAQREADAVQRRHGARMKTSPRRRTAPPPRQTSLNF
jgi:deoxyribodipyrimidine photo-lyase